MDTSNPAARASSRQRSHSMRFWNTPPVSPTVTEAVRRTRRRGAFGDRARERHVKLRGALGDDSNRVSQQHARGAAPSRSAIPRHVARSGSASLRRLADCRRLRATSAPGLRRSCGSRTRAAPQRHRTAGPAEDVRGQFNSRSHARRIKRSVGAGLSRHSVPASQHSAARCARARVRASSPPGSANGRRLATRRQSPGDRTRSRRPRACRRHRIPRRPRRIPASRLNAAFR